MDWEVISSSALSPIGTNSHPSPLINLFKLSKESSVDQTSSNFSHLLFRDGTADGYLYNDLSDEVALSSYDRDLQLWDKDKVAVIDSVMKQLRRTSNPKLLKSTQPADENKLPDVVSNTLDPPDIVMSHECETLITWLDRHFNDSTKFTEQSQRIFTENVTKLVADKGVNAADFISFLIELGKIGNTRSPGFLPEYLKLSLKYLQMRALGSLHIAILNSKGIFLDALVTVDTKDNVEILKTFIKCSDIVFPSQASYMNGESKLRDSEYYFFIAYLIFRCGCTEGFDILLKRRGDISVDLDTKEYPALFPEICGLLQNILMGKQDDKQILLGKFTAQYFPTKHNVQGNLLSKGSNFYVLLLLSIIYPDYYSPCDGKTLSTKEDYLWYQVHLLLSGPPTSMSVAASKLCHSLTQEVHSISPNDVDVLDKIFAYAYSIALSGGIMESLRILMSSVRISQIQLFAVVFVVYFECCDVFGSEALNYIAYTLWNVEDMSFKSEKELPYLIQLAFNRKRNISAEVKILLATVLPNSKSMISMKYCVAENFNEAINPCFIGTPTTKNGMLVVGPLLQKLIKLSMRRKSAKYAILLMAQYSAHVGLFTSAFKCFYCVQDVDNCASVLETCCCYLYDGLEHNNTANLTIEDLFVYYSLVKSLEPNNKHVLELKNIFNCIELCVLVKNGEYSEAVSQCKKNKVFDNSIHILRNESHQIYFNALISYIDALKFLVTNGQQPSTLLTSNEANNLVDLLESAYQNTNSDKNRTIDAVHALLTFISIVPPKI